MTTDTQTPIKDLIENLRVNMKLSQEIVDTLKEENKALRCMATQDLFRLSKQKGNLLAKVHYLDKALQNMISELQGISSSQDQHDRPTMVTLSNFTINLPKEQAAVINEYCHKIKQLRQDIQAQNLMNKRFTHDTLACLSDAITLITKPAANANTYGATRHCRQYNTNQPSLISKEV